jgi:RHS repeat-associated protein
MPLVSVGRERAEGVVTERYTYDPLRRLTGVTDSEGFRAVYEYDAAGNRTRWWANDDRTTPRPRDGFEVTYTYDAADQLLQALRVGAQPNDRQAFVYAYDANGNRVNLNWPGPPGPDTQGMDYVYDREGRLIVAQAYQTNHRGQRVDREVTRLFYDGLGRRLVKEYDPKTGAGGVKRTEYVFDNLDPVVEYPVWNGQREEFYRGGVEAFSPTPMLLAMGHFPEGTQGQTYWVHLDGRGSVAGLTRHLGQSTHNYRYDAYGQLLPAQGNWTDPHNHYTFLGKEWDEHLGLYEFGVRLYDPWAGVWLTREPLPGDAWEPRTWHRYQYAYASPISYYDPYGMQVPPPGGLDRLNIGLGGQLDRLSIGLGGQLDRLSQELGYALDTAARFPLGARCTPSAPGYSPRAANLQALWILTSWFLEIGPDVQEYGPESPFTQILRHHMGVQRIRAEWAAAGYPPFYSDVWKIEEAAGTPWEAYLQENIKMVLSFAGYGSPTPEGPINPLGGVVGSYEVRIRKIDEHTAEFTVYNETQWESGTRVPGTNYSPLPSLKRSETNWATTLVVAAELPLIPLINASPKLAQPIEEINKAIFGLAKMAPGEWGGVGGQMIQYYKWTEPIP